MEHDIVYILKNNIQPNELRYSLRSLKNFPHGEVWFFGGVPEGLVPDRQVAFQQYGDSKWEKVRNSLFKVCQNEEISKEFWLFNDDFFCMRPCEGIPPYYDGTLYKRIVAVEQRHRGFSPYSRELRRTVGILEGNGLDVKNYAVHIPMLIDREKALVVLDKFSECPMFRSLYGNYWSIGGVEHNDVKIYLQNEEPDPESVWLSTSDLSFSRGRVGEYIRSVFTEESVYER